MAEQAAEVVDTGNQEEPSMEEILASIRKIITEEDEDPNAPSAEGAAAADGEDVIDLTEGQLVSADPEPTAAAVIETPAPVAEPTAVAPEPEVAAAAPPAPVETPPEVPEPAPAPEPVAQAAPIIVPEVAIEPEASSAPVAQAEAVPTIDASDTDIDLLEEPALLSEKSAEVAGKAFHDLAQKINLLGNKENTLEGVVKELLRPMLKEWLDENLPRMVLKMVRKEIEKITQ